MIGCDGGYVTAFLDQDIAPLSGSFSPVSEKFLAGFR
jgi:hypothetical protein